MTFGPYIYIGAIVLRETRNEVKVYWVISSLYIYDI